MAARPTTSPAPATIDFEERRRPAIVREAAGLVMALAGLFLLVCLVAGPNGGSLVGSTGAALREILVAIFGMPVSFVAPSLLAASGVWMMLGRKAFWPGARALGLVLVVLAANGLLALPGADNEEAREATFQLAGALGVWLVNWEGLRLVGQFGTVGAALILSGAALIGIALTANVGLPALFGGASRLLPKRPEPAEEVADALAEATDEVPAHISARPARRSLLGGLLGGARTESRRGALLGELDEIPDWHDEPRDQDIAELAAALEAAELEARARKTHRLWPRRDEEEPLPPPSPLAEDDEELEDEEDAADLDEAEQEEAEEEHEIVYKDHSGPLPIRGGNPANEAKVGDGLAKLFPNRWPREQEDAKSSDEASAPEDLFDAAERRRLRQLAEDQAELEASDAEDATHEDDPLFNADYDTRPHGPSGAPQGGSAPEPEPINFDDYALPDLELLADPPTVDARMTRDEVIETSELLTKTLMDFGVEGRVTEVHQGPVVTRFEFRPAAGIRVGKIAGLEHDIAMAMRAISVRILAPIPGKAAVGIEIPNKKRQGVYLKELMACEEFWKHESTLTAALGKTIDGSPHYCDLKKMPHLLIAGATGAGKSVALNTIICSILYRQPPDKVRFIMVDPKRVELSVYADIPHLLAPVVCEPKCAAGALEWAVEEMEERYRKLMQLGVRNIDGYNAVAENPEEHAKKLAGRRVRAMPYIVIIVDELADLMLVARAEVEESIQRLAQMARAVGIHLILATQRPSVNVITGIIKANFPSRIAFQVSQKVDSRTILDANGAENLLGRGDMLFSGGGAAKPIRVQGCFVSDEEVERIADHCRGQMGPNYEIEEFEPKLSEKEQRELAKMMNVADMDDLDMQGRMTRGTNQVMGKVHEGMFVPHDGGSARAGDEEIDEALVRAAARLILESRKASVSLIQRRLKVGFARAGRLMDMLEEMGIVGEFKGSKPRDIVVDCEAAIEELDRLERRLEREGNAPRKARVEPLDPPTSEEEIDLSDFEDEEDAPDEEEEDEREPNDDLDDPNAPWPARRRA